MPSPKRERVYIAGPFSADTVSDIESNVARAERAAAEVMVRGHFAHCPHAATFGVHEAIVDLAGEDHDACQYLNWMQLDYTIIERWATAIYLVGESPGALLEVRLARSIGIPVWENLDQVPFVEGWNDPTDS
jgi:hypothetical protein